MSVAATYAQALYEAAKGANTVEPVAHDLEAFAHALRQSPDVGAMLQSPDITAAAKRSAVTAVAGPTNPTLANFLGLLIDRGRMTELPDIARAFADRVDDEEGRIAVEAITAVPLSAELRAQIVEKVTRETSRTPVLTEKVDPEIIGGLVLRVGSVMLDASVRRHLDAIHRNMSRAPVPVGAPE